MAKQSYHEVEGYIHEVSAVLQSKTGSARYFTAVLQEADKNTRLVVFDLQKHNSFHCAEKDRSPVKLSGVVLSPSKQAKNESDVLINSRSLLSVHRLPFAFDERPSSSTIVRSLHEILSDVREFQRVTVIVKMVSSLEDKETMVRGQRLRRNSVIVADAEELVLLTVWGQHAIDIGCWYRVVNVSVRQYNGMTMLSTTLQSTLGKVEDCGVVKDFADIDMRTVLGEIINAEVKVETYCPMHHLLDRVNSSTLMTRCSRCDSFCKTSKTTVELRGHITMTVDATQEKIVLDDGQLRDLLRIKTGDSMDSHNLAAAILMYDTLSVVMWRQFVIKLSFVDKNLSVQQPTGSGTETTLAEVEVEDMDKLFESY